MLDLTTDTILAIDTCTENLGLCLFQPKTDTPAVFSELLYRQQSAQLHPEIKNLCEKNNYRMKDLSLIVVTNGPGAFTGVRVGLAAADGLSLGINVPQVGISALDALTAAAFAQNPEAQTVHAWMPAHGTDMYVQTTQRSAEQEAKPQVLTVEEAEKTLTSGDFICGQGQHKLPPEAAEGITCLADVVYPDPVMVAKLGWAKFQAHGAEKPQPLYLRPLTYKTLEQQAADKA